MLVRMKSSGCVEDLLDYVARRFIASSRAVEVHKPKSAAEAAILHAENVAGTAGVAGVETAMFTPSIAKGALFVRTPRSRATTLREDATFESDHRRLIWRD